MRTTEKVLAELELDEIPRILVYNKTDLLEGAPSSPSGPRRGKRARWW